MTAHQIYVQMTEGPGTGTMTTAYEIAKAEAEAEDTRAQLIKALADKIQAGWQGSAGEAALGSAGPLRDAAIEGAQNLERAHGLLLDQTHSFDSAARTVVPVSETPPDTNFWDDATPWDTDTEKAVAEHQRQSQHNIDVYKGYDSHTQDNERDLPQEYTPLVASGNGIEVEKPDDPPPPVPPKREGPDYPRSGTGDGDDETRTPWVPPASRDRDPTQPPIRVDELDQPRPPQETDPNRVTDKPPPQQPYRPPVSPPMPPPVGGDPPMSIGGGYGDRRSGGPGSNTGRGGFGQGGFGPRGGSGGGGGFGPGSGSEHGSGGRPGTGPG
ncbi:MAG: hypothetical protein M3548_10855, partial [Actinomycetota bacterium]|nr:hypothetical protein [Actinomycetota bacterium]